MFAHDLCQSQIEYLSNSTDLNRKDRAKRYNKSSIFNLQSSIFNSGLSGLGLFRASNRSDPNALIDDGTGIEVSRVVYYFTEKLGN